MNELAVIPQDELDSALVKVEGLKELFNTPTTAENAHIKKDASLELSKLSKLLEAKRSDAVKPALDEQRRINGIFKPVVDKLESISKGLIAQVADYVRAEEKKERERKALEAKEAAEKLLAGKPVEPVAQTAPIEIPKVSETKTWHYEVVDALLVPRQFLTVDDRKVYDSIKAGTRSIPGLKIYEKVTIGRR